MKLYINRSHEDTRYLLANVTSRKEAEVIAHKMDQRHFMWEADGFPELEPDDYLQYWEGCELLLVEPDGRTFMFTHQWEPV